MVKKRKKKIEEMRDRTGRLGKRVAVQNEVREIEGG